MGTKSSSHLVPRWSLPGRPTRGFLFHPATLEPCTPFLGAWGGGGGRPEQRWPRTLWLVLQPFALSLCLWARTREESVLTGLLAGGAFLSQLASSPYSLKKINFTRAWQKGPCQGQWRLWM